MMRSYRMYGTNYIISNKIKVAKNREEENIKKRRAKWKEQTEKEDEQIVYILTIADFLNLNQTKY